MKRSIVAATVFVALLPVPVRAQSIDNDPVRRRIVVPYVRDATDCIAREALAEPGIAYANREGRLLPALTGPIKRCSAEVQRMVEMHDQTYYAGSGEVFFKGAYLADLTRAVQRRVGGELERRYLQEESTRAAEVIITQTQTASAGNGSQAMPERTGSVSEQGNVTPQERDFAGSFNPGSNTSFLNPESGIGIGASGGDAELGDLVDASGDASGGGSAIGTQPGDPSSLGGNIGTFGRYGPGAFTGSQPFRI